MPSRDPRVDAYIAKAAPFAQPILRHIRVIVHAACPDVEETMKWSFPHQQPTTNNQQERAGRLRGTAPSRFERRQRPNAARTPGRLCQLSVVSC